MPFHDCHPVSSKLASCSSAQLHAVGIALCILVALQHCCYLQRFSVQPKRVEHIAHHRHGKYAIAAHKVQFTCFQSTFSVYSLSQRSKVFRSYPIHFGRNAVSWTALAAPFLPNVVIAGVLPRHRMRRLVPESGEG